MLLLVSLLPAFKNSAESELEFGFFCIGSLLYLCIIESDFELGQLDASDSNPEAISPRSL